MLNTADAILSIADDVLNTADGVPGKGGRRL